MMAWEPRSIVRSVGVGGVNDSADVLVVNALLRQVKAYPQVPESDRVGTPTVTAIELFQKACGLGVDGVIGPTGQTLRRLNDVARGVTLKAVSLVSIKQGGYRITFEGFVPRDRYRLLLMVPAAPPTTSPVEGAEISRTGKLDLTGLARLCDLIDRGSAWESSATTASLALVRTEGDLVSQSNAVQFTTPIRPYRGALRPDLATLDPPMAYTVKTAAAFFGIPPIGNNRYFTYAGRFVTDPAMRGFDCTTYLGSILGLDANASDHPMGGTGETLANHVGAIGVGREKVPGKDVHDFFEANPVGRYIVWSADHVLMVLDGVAHEFNDVPAALKGFMRRPVAPAASASSANEAQFRTFGAGPWTVRELPSTCIPAEWP